MSRNLGGNQVCCCILIKPGLPMHLVREFDLTLYISDLVQELNLGTVKSRCLRDEDIYEYMYIFYVSK